MVIPTYIDMKYPSECGTICRSCEHYYLYMGVMLKISSEVYYSVTKSWQNFDTLQHMSAIPEIFQRRIRKLFYNLGYRCMDSDEEG